TGQLEAVKAEHRSTLQSYEAKETLLAANVQHIGLVETEKASLAGQLSEKEQELTTARETISQLKKQLTNIRAPESPPHGQRVETLFGNSRRLILKKLENRELVQGEIGYYYIIK